MPTLTTNCSNNHGPYQYPEKLIPLMIHNALAGRRLPIYGDGKSVRDWICVRDHCDAIRLVLNGGRVGETYNIGGGAEMANIDLIRLLCELIDSAVSGRRSADLIEFVKDGPGHDRRYAMDSGKMANEFGWHPRESLETGLQKTVRWYVEHQAWVDAAARRVA